MKRTARPGRLRRGIVLGLLAGAALGMLARAAYLGVVHNDYLQAQGDHRHLRVVETAAHRGMIVDRSGEPLAVSTPVDSVWADPGVLSSHPHRLPALAAALGLDPSELSGRLDRRAGRQFLYLRRHVPASVAAAVRALEVPGVALQREYRRYYPAGEVTAHLLGFTDIDDRGQEGLELAYERWLRPVPGRKRVRRDNRFRPVEDVERLRETVPGRPLQLALDRRVQYLAFRALAKAVRRHRARAGCALVVEVASGELLAVVNQPASDPNDRGSLRPERTRNRALTDVFEPGSTLKPLTAAMALESGRFRPRTAVETRPGLLRVGRQLVRDIHDYGTLDLARVISKSSNVGIAKVALSLEPERLWSLLGRAGLGVPTALGFPGEASGHLSHHGTWSRFEHATHAYGYGLSVTAAQLAQAYLALAADGVRRPLSLRRLDGAPPDSGRLVSRETAAAVRAMLEQAASREGTGSRARVPGYRVAGKTGTVHKVGRRGYAEDRYQSIFAGMAPASRPRLVAVVVVDEPRGEVHYGGEVAAPVFAEIMDGALRVLDVAPDAAPATTLALAGAGGPG